jgi:hypothetical protein
MTFNSSRDTGIINPHYTDPLRTSPSCNQFDPPIFYIQGPMPVSFANLPQLKSYNPGPFLNIQPYLTGGGLTVQLLIWYGCASSSDRLAIVNPISGANLLQDVFLTTPPVLQPNQALNGGACIPANEGTVYGAPVQPWQFSQFSPSMATGFPNHLNRNLLDSNNFTFSSPLFWTDFQVTQIDSGALAIFLSPQPASFVSPVLPG